MPKVCSSIGKLPNGVGILRIEGPNTRRKPWLSIKLMPHCFKNNSAADLQVADVGLWHGSRPHRYLCLSENCKLRKYRETGSTWFTSSAQTASLACERSKWTHLALQGELFDDDHRYRLGIFRCLWDWQGLGSVPVIMPSRCHIFVPSRRSPRSNHSCRLCRLDERDYGSHPRRSLRVESLFDGQQTKCSDGRCRIQGHSYRWRRPRPTNRQKHCNRLCLRLWFRRRKNQPHDKNMERRPRAPISRLGVKLKVSCYSNTMLGK